VRHLAHRFCAGLGNNLAIHLQVVSQLKIDRVAIAGGLGRKRLGELQLQLIPIMEGQRACGEGRWRSGGLRNGCNGPDAE
jgi:hypothetical protein